MVVSNSVQAVRRPELSTLGEIIYVTTGSANGCRLTDLTTKIETTIRGLSTDRTDFKGVLYDQRMTAMNKKRYFFKL